MIPAGAAEETEMSRGLKAKKQLLKRKGVLPMPKELIFEPTAMCNLACAMCDRYTTPSELKRRELALPEITRFIEELPASVKRVYISGGEPFMRQDLADICRAFCMRGITVDLQTNGTFVERTLELSKMDGVNLLFSLDGPPDIHNKIRGRPFVFERNMEIFRALRKLLRKTFIITTVITEMNLSSLVDLVRLLEKRDAKPAFLAVEFARRITKEIVEETGRMLGVDREDMSLHLTAESIPPYSYQEFTLCLAALDEELKRRHFNFVYCPATLLERSKDFYYRTYRKNNELYCTHLPVLRIDSCGDVTPCFNIRKGLGNVLEDSVENIWNSTHYREYRINLLENNLTPLCETCYRAADHSYFRTNTLFMRVKQLVRRGLNTL